MGRRVAIGLGVVGFLLVVGCSARTGQTDVPYSVDVRADDFVEGVDNPHFPLTPGARYIYESLKEEGLERTEVAVLAETREVMGTTATVVRDTVYLNDEMIEDTFDWYAQDREGNVWYLGEDVSNYENGVLVDHAGSWEAGVDGALPGIIMFADPAAHIGETYRQEYYAGVAEDMAEVLSVSESVMVPYGSFEESVQTRDYTPLERGVEEHKFYAVGIGLVRAVDLGSGEEEVLVALSIAQE